MHIGGMGDETTLATGVGKVFSKLHETQGGKGELPPKLAIDPARSKLDASKLDAMFGLKGDYKDGVYKATFGRTTKMGGTEVGNAMGVNTWAAFAGMDDGAVVDGDFAMLESELQNVLKTLRKANINIVAIHQHMTNEQPRIWPQASRPRSTRKASSAPDRGRRAEQLITDLCCAITRRGASVAVTGADRRAVRRAVRVAR